MKIQCDVCNAGEASVYCSADEAALCSACDHRVHHANKLAGKHPRFSLLLPSPKDFPLCDICQNKKAFLFCKQDRAILCKDCDSAIHKVNQLTMNHHRFLLTGVKLSPTSSLYSPSTPPAAAPPTTKPIPTCHQQSTSSISEYLIETLPGWHVEEFLDDPLPNFFKAGDNDPPPIWGGDLLDGSLNTSFSPESMGIWVPQAPPLPLPLPLPPPPPPRDSRLLQQFEPSTNMGFGGQIMNGTSIVFSSNNQNSTKSSRKRTSDNGNCFTVPQIRPTTNSKRSRTLWQ